MEKYTPNSIGGKAKAAKIRRAYIPQNCLHCGQPISLKDGVKMAATKAKKFCNKSCAATYNNARVPKREKTVKEIECKTCKARFLVNRSDLHLCPTCSDSYKRRADETKKSNSTHALIRGHARTRMNRRPKVCQKCGYSVFVETCHIKPVSTFPDTATLNEINAATNLVYLCPNCHWEYDHKMFEL